MDSFDLFDSIRLEKANALARYTRLNNIAKILRLIEVFIAVAFILWSFTSLPTVLKLSGEYLYACWSYVLNQHVVFLVGNAIVVLCYVLSDQTDVRNESPDSISSEDNNYRSSNHHETSDGRSYTQVVATPLEESLKMKQTSMEAKTRGMDMVVRSENPIVKTELEVAAETVIEQAAKQIERFQRTQSAKLKREISMKPRGELRRSVTERRRSAVTIDGGELMASSIKSVERLSNEEFRLAVEAFISKQQSFLKQQTIVEKQYYL